MLYFSTLLFSMFTTIAMIPILRHYAVRMRCVDEPNARKTHLTPMPRVGGIAMAVGTLIPVLLWASEDKTAAAIIAGAAIIVAFGFVDDIRNLGYRSKFAAQIAAAFVVVLYGELQICELGVMLPEDCLLPAWLSFPLTLLAIIGVTNAVNLADGLDGLAGGIMLMSFICIAFLAYRMGAFTITLISVAAIGAIFGFLRFNTYPATVFMGDAGSQLLGFLSVTMAIHITQGSSPISPVLPLILLGLPILDTCAVMMERMVKGRSPFIADKNHLHHKLLRLNFFHSEAVFLIYVLQAVLVTAAFVLRYHSEWLLLLGYLGFSAGLLMFLFTAVNKGWRIARPGVMDRLMNHQLKIYIRDRNLPVKVSQAVLEGGFLLLFIVTCTLPEKAPPYMTVTAAGTGLALLMVHMFKPMATGMLLRALIYFFMPLVLYYANTQTPQWLPAQIIAGYKISFGVIVFFAMMTLKTTRRQDGFRVSPLHFLILFLAIVAPNLPDAAIRHFQQSFLAAEIIVLFFTFEVLAGELRGELNRMSATATAGMLIFIAKGLLF